MPRKAFITDLQQAVSLHGVDCIHDVCSGEDDGQFKFLFAHSLLNTPISVTAGVTELSDYPQNHDYFIFAADDCPPELAVVISKLSGTRRKTVTQLLSIISGALIRHIAPNNEDAPTFQAVDGVEMQSEMEYDYDSSADEAFGAKIGTSGGDTATAARPERYSSITDDKRARICADIRATKEAGFKVGALRGLLTNDNSLLSVSIRIARLGISEAAMQAWQVEPSEYLVLVIQYPSYKTFEQLVGGDVFQARSADPIMRVGVSKRYKPSLDEALAAFSIAERNTTASSSVNKGASKSDSTGFRPTLISKSLENLLNQRLISILKYREIGLSRDGAERWYNDMLGSSPSAAVDIDASYFIAEETNEIYPDIVHADHWTKKGPLGWAFPLLAMQMLLRHFVRCTEFCVVCHRKLDEDVDAIKPYVCNRGLCLYQYISMGFGPSFEHEILTQPYTVDLLISFAYLQASEGRLRDFPNGLGMMIPKSFEIPIESRTTRAYMNPLVPQKYSPKVKQPGKEKTTVKFDPYRREILFLDSEDKCPLKLGDWINIEYENAPGNGPFHCRVIEVFYPVVTVGPLLSMKEATTKPPELNEYLHGREKPREMPREKPQGTPVWHAATFEQYNISFDELDDDCKRGAIKCLLDYLPSLPDMRDYILSQKTPDLSKWTDRMSPAALGVLRWVIASNRACIMQIFDTDPKTGNLLSREDRVSGMEGWMQFRFAMGAPDKEQRFAKCVRETEKRLKLKHPTIFAFHGSALHNWHSIIREGLNYEETVNGRAFGNGVYHSLDLKVSISYSNSWNMETLRRGWPKSVLQIHQAVALNEIVNAPAEFKSRVPHLVVQHVDWIQTRYLFVRCAGEKFANFKDEEPKRHRLQDIAMNPKGLGGSRLVVPDYAPRTSKRTSDTKHSGSPYKKSKKGGNNKKSKKTKDGEDLGASNNASILIDDNDDDYVSDETETDDRNLLFDEEAMDRDVAIGRPVPSHTDFIPGKLDHKTLPKLPMPVYANTVATHRLQKDFTALLKVQESTPLHELGWFIDPEKFDCPYQWIVELHSFHIFENDGKQIPLVDDMKQADLKSIVLEMRFPGSYPNGPPFVRVISPRFLSFMQGGGGHVTAGGALCMQLLTNSGWSPVSTIESVLLQIRLAIASIDPKPARLATTRPGHQTSYAVGEAVEAYKRACVAHGWKIPDDFDQMALAEGGQQR